jgi:hypothetical protein
MTNGRDLDRNPHTGVPFFSMLMVDVVLLSESLIGHGTIRGISGEVLLADRQDRKTPLVLRLKQTVHYRVVHLCGGGPKSRERGYRHHPR